MPFETTITGLLSAYASIMPTERGGFALAKLARRFISPLRWDRVFDVRGVGRLRLDLKTYPDCCMAFGLYESDTAKVLRRILKPGGWFVDGGANLGYFTMMASRLVGPAGKVDAFEPDPANGERLESHLRVNAAANVTVHHAALSERAGTIEMTRPTADGSNHGMATAFSALAPVGETYSVPTVRMDERLVGGVPDLVKLDVEGAELSAIRGMRGMMSSSKPPALIVEHNQITSRAAGFTAGELFREVMAMQPRYRFYWIGWRLRAIPMGEELQKIERQGNLLIQAEA